MVCLPEVGVIMPLDLDRPENFTLHTIAEMAATPKST